MTTQSDARPLLKIAAWAFLAFTVFATLSPYSLRPELTKSEPGLVVTIEHVGAFGLLGLLFIINYPKRLRKVCFLVFGSAIGLEIAQALLLDRHGRFVDALEKMFGAGAGIWLGMALLPVIVRQNGLLAKILRPPSHEAGPEGEDRELQLGLFAAATFAVALLVARNLLR